MIYIQSHLNTLNINTNTIFFNSKNVSISKNYEKNRRNSQVITIDTFK